MQLSIMKTHLAHGIEKTEYETQYDENVKVLLSDKQVLARIAKHRTEELMRMTRELEGGINTMCNVSLGIREQALEEGIKVMILTCKELGLSDEDILARIIKNSSVTEEIAKELIVKYTL